MADCNQTALPSLDPNVAKRGWPAIVITFLCVSSLIGYTVYISVIIKHRKCFTSAFYKLAASMVISDVLNLVTMLIYCVPAMLYGENTMGNWYGIVVGYFADGSWFWSSSHMMVIGVNRLTAVCWPIRYPQIFPNRKVYVLMGCCWFYGFLMVTMMYGCQCQYHFESFAWMFTCGNSTCATISLKVNEVCSACIVLTVVLCYVVIFIRMRQLQHKISMVRKGSEKQLVRELQLVVQFMVIGVSISIYELLFWVVPPLVESNRISVYAGLNTLNIFGVLNSAIHPFAYIFFGSEIRQKLFARNDNNKQKMFVIRNNVVKDADVNNVAITCK